MEKRQEEEEQANIKAEKAKFLAPIWAKLRRQSLASVFGGGREGEFVADFIQAVNHDLPMPEFKKPNTGASNGNPPQKTAQPSPGQNLNPDAEK